MNDFNCRPPFPQPIPDDCPSFPQPCPPPACPPIPGCPPAPSVVEGQSLYEAVNSLTNRVNVCINTYNDVIAQCYKTLRNMERAAEENGAYYGPHEVWVEAGYSAEASANYKIIHKACVDRNGEPIRIRLHLAYGNTTNSSIEQDLSSASKTLYADKIMIAQSINSQAGTEGWYGNVFYNGAHLPSTVNTVTSKLYTMGFTRGGTMKVYSNSVEPEMMIKDEIVDAMGVSGVLIQNGAITEDSWQNTIPNYNKPMSRVCMGQKRDTKEVIILTVGDINAGDRSSMTSKQCAEILAGYGCDIAVELCEGFVSGEGTYPVGGSGAMDKGNLMYLPQTDGGQLSRMPTAYAFWYISRNCYYRNDYEGELAELIQNNAINSWLIYLNKINIDKNAEGLKEALAQIAQEIIDRENADKQLQANIDAEAEARKEADNQLQTNINAEAAAREAADTQLQNNIDAEEAAREAADTTLQANIDAEAKARQDADTTLQTNINNVADRVTALENSVSSLQNQYNILSQTVTAQGGQITAVQNTIQSINESVAEIGTSVEQIRNDVTALDTKVNQAVVDVNTANQEITNIKNGTTVLPYIPLTGSENVTGPIAITDENGSTILGGYDQGNNEIIPSSAISMRSQNESITIGAEEPAALQMQNPSGTVIITPPGINLEQHSQDYINIGINSSMSPSNSVVMKNTNNEITIDNTIQNTPYIQLQATSNGETNRFYASNSSISLGPTNSGATKILEVSDAVFQYKGQNVMNNGATADNMEFYNIAVGSGIPSGFSSAELRIAGNSKLSIITVVVTMNAGATASVPYNIEFPMAGWTSTGPLSTFDYSGVYANITGQNEQDLIYWTAHWPDTLNESSSGAQVLTLTFKHSQPIAHTIEFTVVTNRIIHPF